MKCDACGTRFVYGNRPDGVPNGVRMIQKDGSKITLCADCIIRLGMMAPEEKDAFFEGLKKPWKRGN